ncbi:MAG TPA: glycosyltransferase [Gemmatimonadota bacterium]|nr:glycosyltransferase [Gemmatimonadota bacterium]
MRILIVKFAYPQYLAEYHRRHPQARRETYAEQKAAFDHDAFWWGDFWSHALAPLGHEVTEIVMNDEPLQRAWARERGTRVARLDWMLPILRAQAADFRPDALFIQSFRGLRYESLRRIQEGCPSIRRTVGWCGAPPVDRDEFRACDVVLSCVPEIVQQLSRLGHRAFHLHHAFDPRVLERLGPRSGESVELSFVGNVTSQDMYVDRVDLLRRIEREIPVRVHTFLGGGAATRLAKTTAGKVVYPLSRALERAGVGRAVLQSLPVIGPAATWSGSPRYRRAPVTRRNLRGPVFGLEMFRLLRDSKVTLNVHRAETHSASNLRMFEATGVGTCLLTDWKPNLSELFEVDREVVAYRSAEECVEKARWLLDHPAERKRIARAGQERALGEHTFAHRAPELDRVLRAG